MRKTALSMRQLSPLSWQSADSWETADAWESADAAIAPPQAARISSPYILQIVNTCSSAIATVNVGDSYDIRGTSGFTAGSYVPPTQPSITISSTIPNVSYLGWLSQTESQQFRIGRTMIIASGSGSAGQLTQNISITHKDAAGNLNARPIILVVDPYQTQSDRIIDDTEYLFDGYTYITFNQVNANTTVALYLYPIQKFSATQLVAGRNGNLQYDAPHLIKVAPVAVPAPKSLPG